MGLFIHSLIGLVSKSNKKYSPNPAKNIQNRNKKSHKIDKNPSKIDLGGLLEGSGGHLGPKRPAKPPKIHAGRKRSALLGGILEGFGGQNRTKMNKNRKKLDQNYMQKIINFLIDFLSILDRFWRDFGSQNPPKIEQKSINMAKKITSKLDVF